MRKVIVFAVLSLLMIGFIWGNSMASKEKSSAQSTPVAETIQPVVDPEETIEKPKFHNIVRKSAHVIEFLILGLFVCGFTVSLGQVLQQKLFSMPLLIVLFVAVTDEFIQIYSERGSLVKDIALDFTGGIIGISLVWLICFIADRVKKRRCSHEVC